MASTIEDTLKHVVFLARHLKQCDLQCATTAVLLELGIPVKGAGFDYLEKAILIFYEDPTQILTKEIYPAVGNSYRPPASAYQVEKQIRTVINEAWKHRNVKVWGYYFPADSTGHIRKPSNGEFISRIARFIQLLRGCCKGVEHEIK